MVIGSLCVDTLVVGGGQAGVEVVASLRQGGYEGSIALLEAGRNLPYSRPPLTKGYLQDVVSDEDLLLRPAEYWESAGVSLVLDARVVEIDLVGRVAWIERGQAFGYKHLVWATGGTARQLPMFKQLRRVHTVRSLEDAQRLIEEMKSCRRAVVVGGGFIGLEVAAVLADRGVSVTILEAQECLLGRVTSLPVSEYFLRLHRSHGVDVALGTSARGVEECRGSVSAVILSDGRRLETDMVVVGVGLVPVVGPLRDAGIPCTDGIDVDSQCATAAEGVLAVGDCARRVSRFSNGRPVRLESVPNALEHGRIAAAAILGRTHEVEAVPWFWSHQYGTKLQTAGLFHEYDDFAVRGDVLAERFAVVYRRAGAVVAIDCVNSSKDFSQGKALVQQGVHASLEVLADQSQPLKHLLTLAR